MAETNSEKESENDRKFQIREKIENIKSKNDD